MANEEKKDFNAMLLEKRICRKYRLLRILLLSKNTAGSECILRRRRTMMRL